ncbi:hypothetical protein [Salirhabdus salicampi]|nr:hypothetical protein [Salirhabdus salicampi]MCP8617734.1 hypothetical protein [Salirhabdus salicampi]
MQQSHGMGYEEYSRKLTKRIEVEKKRQKEHREMQQMIAKVDQQLHR